MCSVAFTACIPVDLAEYYDDGYFARGKSEFNATGYSSYERECRPTSFLWAVNLVRALEQEPAEWLDIGAATGSMIDLAQAYGYLVHGTELNVAAAKHARRRGLDVRSGPFDPGDWPAGHFRVITAFEVLEHVDNPQAFLKGIRDLLADGGLFCFLVPNVPQHLVDRFGDNLLDFNKSLEHTLYFEPTSLAHLVEGIFGANSLSLTTFDVGSALDTASYALGLVRWHHPPCTVMTAITRALRGESPDLDTRAQIAVALTHAKFGDNNRAVHWLEQATNHRAERGMLVIARAQVLRSAGALIDAVTLLDGHIGSTEIGSDKIPPILLKDCIYDLFDIFDSEHSDLGSVAGTLYGRLTRFKRLEDELSHTRDDLVSVRAELDHLRPVVLEQQVQLDDYDRQIHEILGSTSWRISRPIRAMFSTLTRVQALFAALPFVNRHRFREGLRLLVHGDARALERRMRAIAGSPILEPLREPPAELQHDVWPTNRPLVSVVIPCFNYGLFIHEAVSSILAQTWADLELIVVDAGSTDGTTKDLVRTLGDQYGSRVRTFTLESRTLVGAARNYGLQRARGKYACCLDADDLLRPTYLELALFMLERYHYDVVSTSIELFGDREGHVGVLPTPTLKDMLQGNHIITVGVFRRDLWTQAGGFQDTGLGRDHIYEDWRFWTRIMALGARAANLWREPLFAYRVHSPNSLSRTADIPSMTQQQDEIAKYNRDVINDEALALSDREAGKRYVVTNALDNLVRDSQMRSSERVVLLALPFMLLGGAERLLSRITANLTRRHGWRFVVVTTHVTEEGWGDSTSWFTDTNHEVYHLPKLLDSEHWLDFVDYLMSAKNVRILWMAGSEWIYGVLPRIKYSHPRVRVVDQLFNTVGHTRNNRRLRDYIDLHFVESEEVRGWLLANGEDPHRVLVIESGVDVEEFCPKPRRQSKQFSVGYCGRLSEEKDPVLFVSLAERMRYANDVHFSMTGSGPLEPLVRKRIQQLGLEDCVSYLGPLSDDDFRTHLAALDVLVLPSRVDGRPNIAMESQACGVPVVASSVGALPSLLAHGVTGYLCPPGDLDAFSSAIRAIQVNPIQHSQMRRAARQFAVEHFDATKMIEHYNAALKDLLLMSMPPVG